MEAVRVPVDSTRFPQLHKTTSDLLSSAVKYQMNLYGNTLKEGDVLMTNSPHAGGSYALIPMPPPPSTNHSRT